MQDACNRTIDYLRISVTDRCNLRCGYCRAGEEADFPEEDLLTDEEILLVCRGAARAGISKIKITGGEPLVRKNCPELIGMIKRIPGISQVTLTTNGVLAAPHLSGLCKNGLDAINISLDTLHREKYKKITGYDRLPEVLTGLYAAAASPLQVKVNTVLMEEDGDWERMISLAKTMPVDVRFIERMPIGLGRLEGGVPNKRLRERLYREYDGVTPDQSFHGNGPAVYYRIPGFQGSVGFISAVYEKFCGRCNRIRLTASGDLKPCLCYADHISLKHVLREENASPQMKEIKIRDAICESIRMKPPGHCFDHPAGITELHNMNQIGG